MTDSKADAPPAPAATSIPGAGPGSAEPAAHISEPGAPKGDPGINAHITDVIPGWKPKPEIDPDDPGINASVVS